MDTGKPSKGVGDDSKSQKPRLVSPPSLKVRTDSREQTLDAFYAQAKSSSDRIRDSNSDDDDSNSSKRKPRDFFIYGPSKVGGSEGRSGGNTGDRMVLVDDPNEPSVLTKNLLREKNDTLKKGNIPSEDDEDDFSQEEEGEKLRGKGMGLDDVRPRKKRRVEGEEGEDPMDLELQGHHHHNHHHNHHHHHHGHEHNDGSDDELFPTDNKMKRKEESAGGDAMDIDDDDDDGPPQTPHMNRSTSTLYHPQFHSHSYSNYFLPILWFSRGYEVKSVNYVYLPSLPPRLSCKTELIPS